MRHLLKTADQVGAANRSAAMLACNAPHCFVGLASKYFVGKEGV